MNVGFTSTFILHFLDTSLHGSPENSGPHVTILGHIDQGENSSIEILDLIHSLELSSVVLESGSRDNFGDNGEFSVLRLHDTSNELQKMHELIYESLKSEGYTFGKEKYCGSGFSPHVTITPCMKRFKRVEVNSLSVVNSTFDSAGSFLFSDILGKRLLD